MGKLLGGSILLCLFAAGALEVPEAPKPGARWGYVSDFANALSEAQRDQLEARLKALDASDSTQIAVVTLPSLQGDSLEGFANRLFRAWGIGQKGKNNGVLFLVAVQDHKMRIEVGYGLEAKLTDAVSGMILRNEVTPRFKAGDLPGGIRAGVEAIAGVVRGEYRASAPQMRDTMLNFALPLLIVLLFVVLLCCRVLNWGFGGNFTLAGGSGYTGSDSGGGFSGDFGGFGGGSSGGGGASGSW